MSAVEDTSENEAPETFEAMSLSDEVQKALDEIGYVTPTPVQSATYHVAIAGTDIIVQARTGTGKTAAFGIPMVDRIVDRTPAVQALVLAPTRELALQSAREIGRIGKHQQIRTAAVYGGAPMGSQIDELASGAQIVSGTPGRVLDHLKRGTLDASKLKLLVLDEMDEMLSMGFAKELNAILERIPGPESRQTMCFSATVESDVIRHAERHMKDAEIISLSSDAVGAEAISHYVYMVSGSDRTGDLIRILEAEDPESAIIFCNLRSETERVASGLQQAGFNADWLNGDLPQREREKIMARTRKGELRYLVATDVAARGIDISHLTHVINYSFPEATASYVHRTGRTGRAGRTGCAISLVSPQELGRLYYLRLEYKIFPVERHLATQGELRTRAEADRIGLLEEAFSGNAGAEDLAVARRLLTHPNAERLLAGLLQTFFGGQGDDVDAQAASARRARPASAVDDAPEEDDDPRRGRRRVSARAASSEAESSESTKRERRRSSQRAPADDRPMGSVYLDIGKKDGIRVGELAKFLRERTELARSDIGRIRLRDRHCFVELPAEHVDAALAKLEGAELLGKPLGAERAKGDKG